MDDSVIETSEATFASDVMGSSRPVVVEFWAKWCGPSRLIKPLLEQIAREYSDKLKVVRLNIDENPNLSNEFGIISLPVIGIFKEGKLVKTMPPPSPLRDRLIAEISRLL